MENQLGGSKILYITAFVLLIFGVFAINKECVREDEQEISQEEPTKVEEPDPLEKKRAIEEEAETASDKAQDILSSYWGYYADCNPGGDTRLGSTSEKHYTFSITAVNFSTSPDGIVAICTPTSNCIKVNLPDEQPTFQPQVVMYGGADDAVMALLERYKNAARAYMLN